MKLLFIFALLSPYQPGDPAEVNALFTARYATMALDIASTRHAIGRGAVESNPIVRPLLNDGHMSSGDAAIMAGIGLADVALTRYTWQRVKRSDSRFGRWVWRLASWSLVGLRTRAIINNFRVRR